MNSQRFDRFGMTPSVLKSDGGAPEEVYYDDLTYTEVVPEPSAFAVVAGIALAALIRRRT